MPAFAKTSFPVHPPQCTVSEANNKFVIQCADVGKDIIEAGIVKYNYLPSYTVKMDGDVAVIEVSTTSPNQQLLFTWVVTDKQGNETVGFYPLLQQDG
jgi:hypothetical protein